MYLNSILFSQEFLLEQNLHDELLQYIRLLSTWCEPNAFSRVFMQGECFLGSGKIDRAVDCFLAAAPGEWWQAAGSFFIGSSRVGEST